MIPFPKEPHIHKEWIMEQIEKLNPKTVLDVGCAGGTGLWFYSARFPKIFFFGIDKEQENVSRDELFKEHGRNVELALGDATSLEQETESFDLVICDSIFNALTKQEGIAAAKEVQRVAKKHILLLEHQLNPARGPHDFTELFPGLTVIRKVEGYGDALWDEYGQLMLWSKMKA